MDHRPNVRNANSTSSRAARRAIAIAVSVVVRFARARGSERQQLKWFAAGATVTAASVLTLMTLVSFGHLDAGRLVFSVGGLALPASVGIAIVRHRLFDIDLLIRRTLLYGLLSTGLAAVYLSTVAVLQAPMRALAGGDAQLPIVLSTLVVAALFAPLRRRLQAWIDRAFNRGNSDARAALDRLSGALRTEVELDAITGGVLSTVLNTMEPAHASLWLRDEAADREARGRTREAVPAGTPRR